MNQYTKVSLLENEIRNLKTKLDKAVDDESRMSSDKILKISRQLDTLIVGYHNLNKKANA